MELEQKQPLFQDLEEVFQQTSSEYDAMKKEIVSKFVEDPGIHWHICDWDKMAVILQKAFSNLVSFHENCCILIQISLKFVPNGLYASIGSENGLVPNRHQAIIWTSDGLA